MKTCLLTFVALFGIALLGWIVCDIANKIQEYRVYNHIIYAFEEAENEAAEDEADDYITVTNNKKEKYPIWPDG